jgi:acetyl-CoA carboxylase biotin carboxyl carrier protein
MDVGEIRKLIRLMEEAGLSELEIEDGSGRVRLVRGVRARTRIEESAGDGGGPDELVSSASAASAMIATAADEASVRVPPGMTEIASPMVGTFYRSPAPDAPPFVVPGDVVRSGQVVGIVEAMKMMNEVCAETAARIVSVQAENGASVEYGSPLFLVELLE